MDDLSLNGKVVVVTGGSSGIGKAAVKVFASKGAKVAFNGRRADKGDAVVKEVQYASGSGGDAIYVQGDVTKEEDLQALFNAADKLSGGQGVDFVFVNAGVLGHKGPLIDMDIDKCMDHILDIGVKGAMKTCKAAVPYLVKRGGGTIVLNSSSASVTAAPNLTPYFLSKAAVDALARCLAVELESKNIKVFSINPVVFKSELFGDHSSREQTEKEGDDKDPMEHFAKIRNPSKTMGDPKNIGLFLVQIMQGEGEAKRFPNGSQIGIDGGKGIMVFPISELEAQRKKAGLRSAVDVYKETFSA